MKEIGKFEYAGFTVSLSVSDDESFFFVGSDGGLIGPGSHVNVFDYLTQARTEFESLVVRAIQMSSRSMIISTIQK